MEKKRIVRIILIAIVLFLVLGRGIFSLSGFIKGAGQSELELGTEAKQQEYVAETVDTNVKNDDYDSLKIISDTSCVTLMADDVDSITFDADNLVTEYSYAINKGTLTIDTGKVDKAFKLANTSAITVRVPRDTYLKKIDISVNAGDVIIKELDAEKLVINSNTGKIDAGTFSGAVEISSGQDEVKLVLKGKDRDYNFKLETYRGMITVGNAHGLPKTIGPGKHTGQGYESNALNYTSDKIIISSNGNINISFK